MNEDLIEKWQPVLDQAKHIYSWTEDANLSFLAEEASKCARVVEIGVYMGKSSFVMLASNPNLHLICVDPFMVAGTREVTEYHLRDFIQKGQVTIIQKHTKDARADLQQFKGTVDMAFVDDGHLYTEVVEDIECCLPLLRPGGVICGHDFDPGSDVANAVCDKISGFIVPSPRLWYKKLL